MNRTAPHSRLGTAFVGTWQLTVLLAALALLPLSSPPVEAQERPAAVADEPAMPPTRRPLRRLPTYFARVVTTQQREKIYELQAQYQEQLDALLDQVRKLEQERDKEVFQVLTPEQQQQVTAWTEEARQRRAASRTGSATTPAPTDN
jgi:Spy/CpxP family protein refolding chaperone